MEGYLVSKSPDCVIEYEMKLKIEIVESDLILSLNQCRSNGINYCCWSLCE